MKKTMHIILAVICLLASMLTGCTAREDAGSFTAEDIALRNGNVRVQYGDNAEAILAALGSDCTYSESPSCNYAHNGPNGDDGMDKFYDYAQASVTTCPLRPDGDYIRSAEAWGGQWLTDDGIGIGSTLEDIRAAYGTGYADEYGMIIFYADPQDPSSSQLYFVMDGDVVTALGIA